MRILGIDPGLTRCGVGIVDLNSNRRASFVAVHVIRTPSTSELPARLFELETGLTEMFDSYQPDAIAIERVFSQHNVRTAMGTAQASAVAMLIAARNQLEVAMYTPTEVKAAVTGYGRADKAQITSMVTRLLNLAEPPKPADAADALALALCHAWKGHGKSRIAEHLAKQSAVGVS
ncbi:MAG: crossover junction endodeoxyribonuclease RuvC [Candidatus Nanopelagicales bacterium]